MTSSNYHCMLKTKAILTDLRPQRRCLDHTLLILSSIHCLLPTLVTYFSVLQLFAASSGDAVAASSIGIGSQCYIAHILDLHQQYEWPAMVKYHIHFHLQQRCKMADGDYNGWLWADPDLLNSFVYNCCHLAHHESSHSSFKKDLKDQVCFTFNKGDCTASPLISGHLHKCHKCASTEHRESLQKELRSWQGRYA